MLGADDEFSAAVLDASVAVRWVVTEPGSETAAELFGRQIRWVAPRLLLVEFASALRRKVLEGLITTDDATDSMEFLLNVIERGSIRLAADERIVASALQFAVSNRHRVPDCLYLALAHDEGVALVTADSRLGALAERRGIPTLLLPSSNT